tara:strand:+ start:50 stop:889 length:840 start_codon:yes stop_codon:yes gene_type:complete
MPLTHIRNPLKLAGKIAIVTGGAKGIGKALATELCKYGATIVIADLSEEDASSTAKHIGGIGFKCDVTQEWEIKKLVFNVKKKLGAIDIFVSNAGVCFGEKDHVASASNEVWRSSWEVNVMAHVYAARATLPEMMRNRKGHFVQIISAAALLSQIGDAAYSTTKHAAMGFAESLAITHKSDGIDVSVVCPQYIATGMLGYEEDKINTETNLMSVEELAEIVIPEIVNKKFLILPHPEVYEFMNFKTKSYDKWIDQMHKLKKRTLKEAGTLDLKIIHKYL